MGWFGKSQAQAGPDYSDVDSMEKVQALAERGDLTPMMLLPEMFGGSDAAPNIVYVPAFVVELKDSTDRNIIMPLAQDGTISRYAAEPEYAGSSFVPVSIKLIAHDPGKFVSTIRIWGSGLEE